MELVAFIVGGLLVGAVMKKRFKRKLKTEKMASFMTGYQRGQSESHYMKEEGHWG